MMDSEENQNAIELDRPSQARVFATISCIIIGILLMICITIYLIVVRWYNPKQSNDFIKTTQEVFKSTKDSRIELENDFNKQNDKYWDIIAVSQISDSEIDKSFSLGEKLKSQSESLLNKYPKGNSVTKEISVELHDYLDKSKELGNNYQIDMNLLKEVKKVSDTTEIINNEISKAIAKPADTPEEFGKLSDLYGTKASQIEELKNSFNNISSTEDSNTLKQIVLTYLDSTLTYYKARSSDWQLLAKAYQEQSDELLVEAANNAASAANNYNEALSKFIDDIAKYKENSDGAKSKYTSKFRELKDQYDKISLMYSDLEAKY